MKKSMTLLVVTVLAMPCMAREEPKGTRFLVGGGAMPDAVRARFFQLAGGKGARIVVVPTASESADDKNAEEYFLADWKKLAPTSVTLLHTRDRKRADEASFVKPLSEATAVWFSGGDQRRLTQTYLGTAVEKELNAILGRDGVIGGTSAGAAIMSKVMITGGDEQAEIGPGFGWLDWCIVDQHFLKRGRMKRLLGTLDANPGLNGLGIDESTAAIVHGKTIEVLGDSTVTLIWSIGLTNRKTEVLRSGEKREISR